MLIDCDRCAARGAACAGCFVTAVLDTPPELAGLTAAQVRAIEVFARAGFDVQVIADRPAVTPTSSRAPRRRTRRPRPRIAA